MYVIDEEKSEEIKKLVLNLSDKVLTRLEDVGQQLALKFNNEGSALAAGGEVVSSFTFSRLLVCCITLRCWTGISMDVFLQMSNYNFYV